MRLLYVEDEVSMARTVELMLRQSGYEYDTVHCGLDAIDKASSNSYDLILLDIMLPDLDGYEVIERLRQMEIDTPFLVQTGLLDRGGEVDGASLGVTEFLIKPFNRNELIKGIETVVGRANPESPVAQMIKAGQEEAARDDDDDRREHRRFKTLKSGRVTWPSPFTCVILNMCYGGAAIRLPYPEKELPDQFSLSLSAGSEVRCEVCWRVQDKVGVKFI